MKIVVRTLIILAAGLLVAGALLAFGQSGLAARLRAEGLLGGHHARGEQLGQAGGFAGRRDSRPEGDFAGAPLREGGRGERHGPSLLGLGEVVANLAKIGVIVALVVVGSRLWAWLRRDRGGQDRPSAPTAT